MVCVAGLGRGGGGVLTVLDDEDKGGKGGKGESEEEGGIGALRRSWLHGESKGKAMDLLYHHPTNIHLLRACTVDDALDLVAVGGDHAVDVLLVVDTSVRCIASFHIGSRVTALAWSNTSVSPSSSDNWSIECVNFTSPVLARVYSLPDSQLQAMTLGSTCSTSRRTHLKSCFRSVEV
jgi:hypothetical protein